MQLHICVSCHILSSQVHPNSCLYKNQMHLLLIKSCVTVHVEIEDYFECVAVLEVPVHLRAGSYSSRHLSALSPFFPSLLSFLFSPHFLFFALPPPILFPSVVPFPPPHHICMTNIQFVYFIVALVYTTNIQSHDFSTGQCAQMKPQACLKCAEICIRTMAFNYCII